ncbi:MAG: class I SAM-dependent methyltransferase [Bacteroidetes bacterium]|nr:class I SAM-dependent methyltransferase [Bacteroidota bacterium]
MEFKRITPPNLPEYELLDSGDFEKLERFGKYILRRPEPQAVWRKTLDEKEWDSQCHAYFSRKGEKDSETGNWHLKQGMPDRWWVKYKNGKLDFQMRLGLTSFKHVGIFPEQAENWDFIANCISDIQISKPKVLNLFAYTGGASLAACQAGADVTHVDSVKQVVTWSRENMEKSGLDGIRWVVEDAFKFVQRELKRDKKYHGIILDPPAYGRGPDGEKWLLEKQIAELLEMCAQILEQTDAFFLINLYSMGFSAMITENLVKNAFRTENFESGEIYLQDGFKKNLPLGTYLRFRK